MSADVRKVVIQWFVEDVLNTGNVGAVGELFTPDYVAHVPIAAQPLRGIEAWQEGTAAYLAAFPDLYVTIEDLISEGEQVAARTTWRGTHRGAFLGVAPTGKTVAVTGIRIWRIAGGKMVEEWVAEDLLGLLHQLGARPGPAKVEAEPPIAGRAP